MSKLNLKRNQRIYDYRLKHKSSYAKIGKIFKLTPQRVHTICKMMETKNDLRSY